MLAKSVPLPAWLQVPGWTPTAPAPLSPIHSPPSSHASADRHQTGAALPGALSMKSTRPPQAGPVPPRPPAPLPTHLTSCVPAHGSCRQHPCGETAPMISSTTVTPFLCVLPHVAVGRRRCWKSARRLRGLLLWWLYQGSCPEVPLPGRA